VAEARLPSLAQSKPRVPSVRLIRSEPFVPAGPRDIGSRRDLDVRPFSRHRGLSLPTVPHSVRHGFIRSALVSSSKFLRHSSRPLLVRAASPARVPALFATSPMVSTSPLGAPLARRGASQFPATFRPQAFSASRRLAPPSATRACSIPWPRPGFFVAVQGFLPIRSATRLIDGCGPPAVGSRGLIGDPIATRARLDFEASFHGPERASNARVSRALRRSPLRLPSSFGYRLPHRRPASAGLPLLALPPWSSRLPLRTAELGPVVWPSACYR